MSGNVARDNMAVVEYAKPEIRIKTRYVQVRGDVSFPGEYLFREGQELYYYLQLAGGVNGDNDPVSVIVFRGEGSQRRTFSYQMDDVDLAPAIRGGDVLVFHSIEDAHQLILSGEEGSFLKGQIQKDVYLRSSFNDYIMNPAFKRTFNQVIRTIDSSGCRSVAIADLSSGRASGLTAAAISYAYAAFLATRVLVVKGEEDTDGVYSGQKSEDLIKPAGCGSIDLLGLSEASSESGAGLEFRLSEMFGAMGSEYDLILISLSEGLKNIAIDPVVLAGQAEGVLIAVPSSLKMKKTEIDSYCAELTEAGLEIIGMVTVADD